MNFELTEARALLKETTPLKGDCGALCGGACCRSDEDGQGGVYLFPGESVGDWATCADTEDLGGCQMCTCHGACARDQRPLACRLFPLTPIRVRGEWTVRLDSRAWAMCPLMRGGMRGLDPEFVIAAKAAVRLLAQDAQMRAFMGAWARLERVFRDARGMLGGDVDG